MSLFSAYIGLFKEMLLDLVSILSGHLFLVAYTISGFTYTLLLVSGNLKGIDPRLPAGDSPVYFHLMTTFK
jgi:hypothetical protein